MQLALGAIVVALAAVQSVFGVGLLVFGTPALLLLDLPFEEVLGYLLPCSIVISALQVRSGERTMGPVRIRLLTITAPAVLVATAIILTLGVTAHIRPIVGAMLILTAATRLLGPLREAVGRFVRRHLGPMLAAIGLIHGASNLGGGLLAATVGAVYDDKDSVRLHIAFGYGVMASIQLAVLFLTAPPELLWGLWLVLPALSGLTFGLVGQRLFRAAGQRAFQAGLTGLILAFGVVLLIRA